MDIVIIFLAFIGMKVVESVVEGIIESAEAEENVEQVEPMEEINGVTF